VKKKAGSLNIVLRGDWNKMYCDPAYLAHALFSGEEVTIEVMGKGIEFVIQCRYKGLTIIPSQDRMQIVVSDFSESNIILFASAIKALVQQLVSPKVEAFGFNIVYDSSDDETIARMIDNIDDANALTERGCTILATTIKREVSFKEHVYNIEYNLVNGNTKISFNQHNVVNCKSNEIDISEDRIKSFIQDTEELIDSLGYEIDEEE